MKIASKIAASMAFLTLGSLSESCLAAVPPEEARQLGTTLTLFGAIKAGNTDGTIPPYEGALTTPPADFKPGSGFRPDPYRHEKPLYSINATNMDRYADKLSEATKLLMTKYPDFRIDVYPTHRDAGYPQKVLDNTVLNASRCSTTDDGVTMTGNGCHGGLPFPIPTTGAEVMWNHLLSYNGIRMTSTAKTYYVTPFTGPVMTAEIRNSNAQLNFYKDDYSPSEPYYILMGNFDAPPVQSGSGVLYQNYLNPLSRPQQGWQYLVGQRRVKLSPEISYDTPSPYEAGAMLYDENQLFNGALDRFDFKLIGRKEVYMPYNCYRAVYEAKTADYLTKNFANPDYVRWELHRAWVVEATLKPGKHHTFSRRVFYLDEDSYSGGMADAYDRNGKLYHGAFNMLEPMYDYEGTPNAAGQIVYDFAKGIYAVPGVYEGTNGLRLADALPAAAMSPDVLAGRGVR